MAPDATPHPDPAGTSDFPEYSEPAGVPDYELDPTVGADTPEALKALAEPVRVQILDLVLERAATVTELAAALDRPKSSTAYHVDVLVDAGLLRVVRTRKVRAVEERFYGRVGRTIVVGDGPLPDGTRRRSFLAEAIGEARPDADGGMLATLRHARVPADRAEEFFERVVGLAEEFTRLPREGDVVYGFVAAVYRTDHPSLPPVTTPATAAPPANPSATGEVEPGGPP